MPDVVMGERCGGVTVARCQGELDLAVRDELRTGLMALVTRDVHTVVVDLSDVTFMDASSLGALCATAGYCEHHDVRILLAGVPQFIQRLLDIVGLATAFVTAHDAVEGTTLAEQWDDLTGPRQRCAEPVPAIARPTLATNASPSG